MENRVIYIGLIGSIGVLLVLIFILIKINSVRKKKTDNQEEKNDFLIEDETVKLNTRELQKQLQNQEFEILQNIVIVHTNEQVE